MKNYWISWYSAGPFILNSPWWISGSAVVDDRVAFEDERHVDTICAAVQAPDDRRAKAIILASHDKPPADLRWRFCYARPDDWVPFNDRFQKADWMQWAPL